MLFSVDDARNKGMEGEVSSLSLENEESVDAEVNDGNDNITEQSQHPAEALTRLEVDYLRNNPRPHS